MATTTNFGWDTPDDTDLVKDGAAAIRTALNGVDTSFVDLKGGTSGQILSKASNTDLDYAWITNDVGDITEVAAGTGISGGGTSGTVTVTNSMATEIDAKGDLIAGTGADAFSRLAVGTNGQFLAADSTASTGLAWVSSTSPALTLITTASFTTSAAVNVNDCFSATYDNYLVALNISSTASFGTDYLGMRLRASGTDNSSANYSFNGPLIISNTSSSQNLNRSNGLLNAFNLNYGAILGLRGTLGFFAPFLSARTIVDTSTTSLLTGNDSNLCKCQGAMSVSTSYDGFSIIPVNGTITGTLTVYGLAQ
jgi:hypothetical protein